MEITDEIVLSEPQLKVFESRKPLTLNMAGQRGGKSHLIGVKTGLFIINFPKIRGLIGANTYMQLTQSTLVAVKKVWKKEYGLTEYDSKGNPRGDYVVHKQPPDHFTKFEKFDNYRSIISFRNGGIIFMASLDNYEAHDGKEIGWAELDETKDTKEDALKAVILARLSQPGLYYHKDTSEIVCDEDIEQEPDEYPMDRMVPYNPCCINTSPAIGVVKWLTDMFGLQDFEKEIFDQVTDPDKYFYREDKEQAVCIYSTYWNEHNLPNNYIDIRLSNLSENEGLKFVYGYPFARTGDSYFRNFNKLRHIIPVKFVPGKPIHITYDFNAKPYMTLIVNQVYVDDDLREFQIRAIREYCLSSPHNSTEAVTKRMLDDFVRFDPHFMFYGDATGDYRQAGSGDHTQFDTVRDVLSSYISRASDRVPRKNKSVFNRRDFVDKILEEKLTINYNGRDYKVILMMDPSCENLISDFQWLKEDVDGKFKEKEEDPETKLKYEKIGHTSDAEEYFICELLEAYYA